MVQVVWCPQVYNKFKEYEKKSNLKIFKVMKSTSKTIFGQYLLSNILYDEF